MEFAVVNNYMGPVATKVMKGYSEDDVRGGDDFKVYTLNLSKLKVYYYYTCGGIEVATANKLKLMYLKLWSDHNEKYVYSRCTFDS